MNGQMLQIEKLIPVLPGLGQGIHVFFYVQRIVDGRDKPGHDVR